MSFSSDLRAELARIQPRGKKAQDTSAATLLVNLCRFSLGEDRNVYLCVTSGNTEAVKKCFTLVQKTVTISRDFVLEKNVPQCMPAGMVKYLQGMQILGGDGQEDHFRCPDGTLPQALLEGPQARDYVREMFLCTGFMSDPQQRYHLEFRCVSGMQAEQLRETLEKQGLHAGVTRRKSYFVVYLKDSEDIATLLSLMGANVTRMATENARIIKDLRNKVNRRVNCETANIGKTVESAGRQREEIRLLRERGVLETLPAPLREAARLREEHPGESLTELGKRAVPPVGRSGMNHRFRKLSELAGKLQESAAPGQEEQSKRRSAAPEQEEHLKRRSAAPEQEEQLKRRSAAPEQEKQLKRRSAAPERKEQQ